MVLGMTDDDKIKKGVCPVCDSSLAFQEGCKRCYACGWGGCDGG
jgi:competence CoiA-like predicted nuclease